MKQSRAHALPMLTSFAMILMVVAGLVWSRSAQAQLPKSGNFNGNPTGTGNGTATDDFVPPPELKEVDVVEHLDQPLPLEAVFRDTEGEMVRLGGFFDAKRPVLLVFAYHTCPMLCSLVLDGVVKGLKQIPWTVGKEFDVVSISIDPKDTPELAAKKRAEVTSTYGKGEGVRGWHFLVGDETNIRRVTEAVGFEYHYDPSQKQFAHPAAMYLATPDGKMARYLYGIEYDPSDLRFGLLEASQGRSLSIGEKVLMYCYQYDPKGKKYALVAMNVMRLGGAATVVFLGGLLAVLWRRERIKKRRASGASTGETDARNDEHVSETPARAP